MNDREFFEQAAARAEQINTACKDYELARASLEALKKDGIILHTTVEAVDEFENDKFELTPLPSNTEKLIINMYREIYEQRIEECKRIVNGYVSGPYTQASITNLAETYMNAMNRKIQEVREEDEADKYVKASQAITAELNKNNTKTLQEMVDEQAEAPSTAAEKVSNERIEELLRQGLTHAQIAKMVGMTANAVSHRIAYIKDKKEREQGVEKPAPKPRAYTKDIISDAELEEQYFKRGLTIKAIAEKFGINPSSLYKRVEAMRDKRFEIAKECVSSQQ